MSHLPFTILAYFLNGVAVTIDKFLLAKKIPDPLIYIFYYSLVSLVVVLFSPFTKIPNTEVLALASTSTLLWTVGAYLMFRALQKGQLSRVIPLIGTIIPLFLLIDSKLRGEINLNETWAVFILIVGLVFLTLYDWRGKFSFDELVLEIGSSLFFAVSYVLLRQAYLQDDFFNVFVWSRPILIPVGILILLIPASRKIVWGSKGTRVNIFSKSGLLFALGQTSGGISELLLTFSVSLATPALVNSLQGTQYVFLFFFSLILSKKYPEIFSESFSKMIILAKIIGIFFIALGLYMLAFSNGTNKPKVGVTYSPRYAKELGLEPKTNFVQALDELKIKKIRFPVYWDEVEKSPGKYDFSEVEYYLGEAQKRDVEVVLVVGYKQPRWPECFTPDWAEDYQKEKLQENILKLTQTEVTEFKKYPNIKIWQVENEPYLNFGDCLTQHPLDDKFVDTEVSLVKSLDARPIMITDSGELTNWYSSMKAADIHGISLYRTVWNPGFGQVTYPFPPNFYKIKAAIVKRLAAKDSEQTIVSELQAEPWVPAEKNISSWDVGEQTTDYPPENLTKNVNFASQTGFTDVYLWGVEWWYFMGAHGHPEYLQTAKEIFNLDDRN